MLPPINGRDDHALSPWRARARREFSAFQLSPALKPRPLPARRRPGPAGHRGWPWDFGGPVRHHQGQGRRATGDRRHDPQLVGRQRHLQDFLVRRPTKTKRFFVISKPDMSAGQRDGRPAGFPQAPEEGVRKVKVSFDGAALTSIHPTATKAEFPIPAGAKAVTEVQVTYGPEGARNRHLEMIGA